MLNYFQECFIPFLAYPVSSVLLDSRTIPPESSPDLCELGISWEELRGFLDSRVIPPPPPDDDLPPKKPRLGGAVGLQGLIKTNINI